MRNTTSHQLVSIGGITPNTTTIYFTRQSNIQDRKGVVKGIELFPAEKLPTLNGTSVLPLAQCRLGIMTLMSGNNEVLKEVPLSKFYAPDYNGILPDVSLENIEWEKSYVKFQGDIPVGTYTLLLSVIYTLNN